MTATEDDPLQRALADACLQESAGEAIATDLGSFLLMHGVDPHDVAAILAAPRRLAVYRAVVRNGLFSVVTRLLPRTRARMNHACAGRFDGDFSRFLEEAAPRAPYLRLVPAELVAWAAPRWQADSALPAYLSDLAAHELACFELGASEAAAARASAEAIAPESRLLFCACARVERYRWAVHQTSLHGVEAPCPREVHLLGYRDQEHSPRWVEVDPLAAAILRKLLVGNSLAESVTGACGELGASARVEQMAGLLADLASRGVIVGTLASDPA